VGIDTLLSNQLGPGLCTSRYTTGMQNLQPIEGQPPIRISDPATVVGRQLFLKMNYFVQAVR
jgi:hypothetical protein